MVEDKTTVKILFLSNSFGDDTAWHLREVLCAGGAKEAIVANLYIGGCSVLTHWDNICKDAKAYEYRKWTAEGFTNQQEVSVAEGFKDEDWDYIILSTANYDMAVPSMHGSQGFLDALNGVVAYAQENKPQKAILFWNMTWAYNDSCLPCCCKDARDMYETSCRVTKKLIAPIEAFKSLIPNGTAVQNLREYFPKEAVYRDDLHLGEMGQYTVSLMVAHALGYDVDRIIPKCSAIAPYADCIKTVVENSIRAPFSVTT